MNDNDNTRQLMLILEEGVCAIEETLENIREKARRASEEKFGTTDFADQAGEEQTALRGGVNRLMRILHTQCGMSYHVLWVLAYHRMFTRTGFHAIAEGLAAPGRAHLDAVQAAGLMSDMQAVVAEMLTDPEFQPGRK